MNETEQTVTLSARVPMSLAERLEKAAEDADRTVSAELRRALKAHLKEVSGKE